MTSAVFVGQEIYDQRLFNVIRKLGALGANPSLLMQDFAVIGESTTRERFRDQYSPEGIRWKPSIRAALGGGKTLTMGGHLGDSITHSFDSKMAQWGTNMVYAAIHQFGGIIKAKVGNLRFKLANGAWASVKQVVMPKRAYLGLSESDKVDMLDAAQVRIEAITNAG